MNEDLSMIALAGVLAGGADSMTVLKPSPVSSARFTRGAEGLLVAEASDLPPFGRVYDDAADEGLTLVNPTTGREVVYAVDNAVRDREGDLVYWELRPVNTEHHSQPTVRVYND